MMTINTVQDQKTVLMIAKEIGTTKGAVQKRIGREPLKSAIDKHVSIVNGTKYLSEEGQRLVKMAFSPDGDQLAIDASTPVGIDIGTPIGIDADVYKTLKKQLDEKSQILEKMSVEIDLKNRQIEDLMRMNDQQQQLQAQLMNSIKMLEAPKPAKWRFWK